MLLVQQPPAAWDGAKGQGFSARVPAPNHPLNKPNSRLIFWQVLTASARSHWLPPLPGTARRAPLACVKVHPRLDPLMASQGNTKVTSTAQVPRSPWDT